MLGRSPGTNAKTDPSGVAELWVMSALRHAPNREAAARRPGNVDSVEDAIARLHGRDQEQVRQVMWQDLATLV